MELKNIGIVNAQHGGEVLIRFLLSRLSIVDLLLYIFEIIHSSSNGSLGEEVYGKVYVIYSLISWVWLMF